jgi:hypothetical protein
MSENIKRDIVLTLFALFLAGVILFGIFVSGVLTA